MTQRLEQIQRLNGPRILQFILCRREDEDGTPHSFDTKDILEAADHARTDPRGTVQAYFSCSKGILDDLTTEALVTELNLILAMITIAPETWRVTVTKHERYECFILTLTTSPAAQD